MNEIISMPILNLDAIKRPRFFSYPEFTTHKNYLNFIAENCLNVSITHNLKTTTKIFLDENVYKKIRLATLTLENIKAEWDVIMEDNEYAAVCVSWIPVKVYYLLYYLAIIQHYLISTETQCLHQSHIKTWGRSKDYIADGTISFGKNYFNFKN